MKLWLAAAAAVLVLGIVAGTAIYVTAEDDGDTYSVEDSRAYRWQLEQFGGKASVLFDKFQRWFAGLWHGKSLGVTIGWIGALVSLGIVLVARLVASDDPR